MWKFPLIKMIRLGFMAHLKSTKYVSGGQATGTHIMRERERGLLTVI